MSDIQKADVADVRAAAGLTGREVGKRLRITLPNGTEVTGVLGHLEIGLGDTIRGIGTGVVRRSLLVTLVINGWRVEIPGDRTVEVLL